MTRFWLATFVVTRQSGASVAPIAATGSERVAIEVVRDDTMNSTAILFSTADDVEQPSLLTCVLGFTNASRACNFWSDRGFHLVDADIHYDAARHVLTVRSPGFVAGERSIEYDHEICQIHGIAFDGSGTGTLIVRYRQDTIVPDGCEPASFAIEQTATWLPRRANVTKLPSTAVLHVDERPAARCPSLVPLTNNLAPHRVWSGDVRLPRSAESQGPARLARRNDTFRPAFRFEQVETLGFRIDASTLGQQINDQLAALVEPLNFHLLQSAGRRPLPDFQYRAAAHTVVIELLRYGRMRSVVPEPPLEGRDFQSQHELVVRLLVGRIDDDTAQARDPATFVPVLFVDNPWSKLLGRSMLGYDKRLAEFRTSRNGRTSAVRPDGRLEGSPHGEEPVPLRHISEVTLTEQTGQPGRPLLELDYAFDPGTDPDVLQLVTAGLSLGSAALAAARWRLSDFNDVVFQSSFADLAITDMFRAIHSVQVAPVDGRIRQRDRLTWIPSVFLLDTDIAFGLPAGDATLTLHAARHAPPVWNLLCRILGDGQRAVLPFSIGGWYRLVASMDLSVDDGLDWARSVT
jgi:hypothetical protein